jgi:hypothetical protein
MYGSGTLFFFSILALHLKHSVQQDQSGVWAESRDHTPTETTPCIEITLCEPRHASSAFIYTQKNPVYVQKVITLDSG